MQQQQQQQQQLPNELIENITMYINVYKDYAKFRSTNASIRNSLMDLEMSSDKLRIHLVPLILFQYSLLSTQEKKTQFESSTPLIKEIMSIVDQAKTQLDATSPFIEKILSTVGVLTFLNGASTPPYAIVESILRAFDISKDVEQEFTIKSSLHATNHLGTRCAVTLIKNKTITTIAAMFDRKGLPTGHWKLYYRLSSSHDRTLGNEINWSTNKNINNNK